jgi:hypothetical protein
MQYSTADSVARDKGLDPTHPNRGYSDEKAAEFDRTSPGWREKFRGDDEATAASENANKARRIQDEENRALKERLKVAVLGDRQRSNVTSLQEDLGAAEASQKQLKPKVEAAEREAGDRKAETDANEAASKAAKDAAKQRQEAEIQQATRDRQTQEDRANKIRSLIESNAAASRGDTWANNPAAHAQIDHATDKVRSERLGLSDFYNKLQASILNGDKESEKLRVAKETLDVLRRIEAKEGPQAKNTPEKKPASTFGDAVQIA